MIDPKNNMPLMASAASSSFFTDHLTAFEIWLDFESGGDETPVHLPVLLQVRNDAAHISHAIVCYSLVSACYWFDTGFCHAYSRKNKFFASSMFRSLSTHRHPPPHSPPPLQVLLSPTHRLRALLVLRRYLTLGPHAIKMSLLVGLFPYIVRLLQSTASDIRQVSCQNTTSRTAIQNKRGAA